MPDVGSGGSCLDIFVQKYNVKARVHTPCLAVVYIPSLHREPEKAC